METERLILRPWNEADADDLYLYAKDPAVGPIAGWPPHKNVAESLKVIKTVFSAPETYAVVLKATGKPVGCVGLMTGRHSNLQLPDNECEIGYWIGVPYWGRGLIPEAVRCLQHRAFTELGMEKIWCGYFEGNHKSRRVQEKCGFSHHHTISNVYNEATNDKQAEHISCLTKEQWSLNKYTKQFKIFCN